MKSWVVIQKVDFINLGYIIVKAFDNEQRAESYKSSLAAAYDNQFYSVLEIKIASNKDLVPTQTKYNLSNDIIEDKNVTAYMD